MADKGKEKVRLYYLGGLGRKVPRPDGKILPDVVTASGTRFILPPRGEYLELEARFAKELEAKHKYLTAEGEFSAFTRDKRIADRVKAGESVIQAYLARTVLTAESLSEEQLLAEVRKRGISLEVVKAERPEEDQVPETQAKQSKAPAKAASKKTAAKKTVNKNAPAKAVDLVSELTSKATDSDGVFEDGIDLG